MIFSSLWNTYTLKRSFPLYLQGFRGCFFIRNHPEKEKVCETSNSGIIGYRSIFSPTHSAFSRQIGLRGIDLQGYLLGFKHIKRCRNGILRELIKELSRQFLILSNFPVDKLVLWSDLFIKYTQRLPLMRSKAGFIVDKIGASIGFCQCLPLQELLVSKSCELLMAFVIYFTIVILQNIEFSLNF